MLGNKTKVGQLGPVCGRIIKMNHYYIAKNLTGFIPYYRMTMHVQRRVTLQKTQRVTKALNIDTPESHTRIYSHDMGCVFKQKCTYGVAMHV